MDILRLPNFELVFSNPNFALGVPVMFHALEKQNAAMNSSSSQVNMKASTNSATKSKLIQQSGTQMTNFFVEESKSETPDPHVVEFAFHFLDDSSFPFVIMILGKLRTNFQTTRKKKYSRILSS